MIDVRSLYKNLTIPYLRRIRKKMMHAFSPYNVLLILSFSILPNAFILCTSRTQARFLAVTETHSP